MPETDKYSEIINLPHHVSETRARMPRSDRAAQFSSFAALTGYEDGIAEAGRLTCSRLERSEEEKAELDEKINMLAHVGIKRPVISLLYFREDGKKAGGAYIRYNGKLRRVDRELGWLIFENGEKISMGDIYELNILTESSIATDEEMC